MSDPKNERAPFVPEKPQAVPDLPNYDAFMANWKYGRTKADRQAAYEKLVAARDSIVESNKGLPERNRIGGVEGFPEYLNSGQASWECLPPHVGREQSKKRVIKNDPRD
jgi:hypothetical protein